MYNTNVPETGTTKGKRTMKLNYNGKTYELRGGAWLDEMNACMYDVIDYTYAGYLICREKGSETEFAIYAPNYLG